MACQDPARQPIFGLPGHSLKWKEARLPGHMSLGCGTVTGRRRSEVSEAATRAGLLDSPLLSSGPLSSRLPVFASACLPPSPRHTRGRTSLLGAESRPWSLRAWPRVHRTGKRAPRLQLECAGVETERRLEALVFCSERLSGPISID